jgi:Alpha-glutamyl/putrescinyl thymine pyrophosphorylase clade 3
LRENDIAKAQTISKGLQAFSKDVTPLHGIAHPDALTSLVRQMIDSLHRIEFVRRLGERPLDQRRMDPASELFDPIKAAFLHKQAGNLDEAAWLVFLATHFGYHIRHRWELTRRVYGALGEEPNWTWLRTSTNQNEFRNWFQKNSDRIRGIPFGNHRKYESLKPHVQNNLADTIDSYIAWVGANRGFANFLSEKNKDVDGDRFQLFDVLYRSSIIIQFGRTAKFDLLTMLGKLKIADIEPPYPYLNGASGPLFGAKLLFHGDAGAKFSADTISENVVKLGNKLDLGMQVMEDSLCNWQKSPRKYLPFRG